MAVSERAGAVFAALVRNYRMGWGLERPSYGAAYGLFYAQEIIGHTHTGKTAL